MASGHSCLLREVSSHSLWAVSPAQSSGRRAPRSLLLGFVENHCLPGAENAGVPPFLQSGHPSRVVDSPSSAPALHRASRGPRLALGTCPGPAVALCSSRVWALQTHQPIKRILQTNVQKENMKSPIHSCPDHDPLLLTRWQTRSWAPGHARHGATKSSF